MSEGWTSSKATPEEMKTFLAAEKEAHKTKLDRMFCTHEWPSVRLDGAPCDLKKSFFELLDLATEKGWIQKQNNILEAVRAGLNFSISDIVDDKSFFDQQPQEIPSNEEVKKIIEEMDKLERFGIFENFINDPRFESAMNGKQFFSMEELVSLYKFNIMLSNIMVSARVQIVEGFKKDGFAVQIDCEKTLELYTYSIIDKIVRSFKGQYAEGANLLIIIFRSKIPFQIATLGWNTIRGDDVFVMDKLYDLLPENSAPGLDLLWTIASVQDELFGSYSMAPDGDYQKAIFDKFNRYGMRLLEIGYNFELFMSDHKYSEAELQRIKETRKANLEKGRQKRAANNCEQREKLEPYFRKIETEVASQRGMLEGCLMEQFENAKNAGDFNSSLGAFRMRYYRWKK